MQITRRSIRPIAKKALLLLAAGIAITSLAACSGNHSGDTTSGGTTGATPSGGANVPAGAARRTADQAKQDTTP